jgi:hypothetical protein
MTAILGFDNSDAADLLGESGQPVQLILKIAGVPNPVTGEVIGGTTQVTNLMGYPSADANDMAKYFGVNNVNQTDAVYFLEAIIEPLTSMTLNVNGDIYQISQVQAITDAGYAKLFVLKVSK